jgi:nucleolysin TIA-1/TIAR
MSDNGPPPTSAQLPPPPQTTAGAPGYENGHSGSNPAHMPPPPLAPVIIPQNTNPIPTAITSPMGDNGIMPGLSPDSSGGFVRRAAPEPNKRALYVGGLDPRVTEDVLRQIFETTGHVQNVKIIPDKNVGAVSINFTFVKSFENSCISCVKFS